MHVSRCGDFRTSIENSLLATWDTFLPGCGLGADDNVLHHGLNSLMAALMCSHFSALFGVEVSVLDLYNYPSARQLSHRIETLMREQGVSA